MKLAGITGNIGCGKSSVAALFAGRGAIVVDVDQLSRDLQRPGHEVFDEMVKRWGDGILDDSGELDRPRLAEVVFEQPKELQALNAITMPVLNREIVTRVMPHLGSDAVVVIEAALLIGGMNAYGTEGVIVVDTEPDVAIRRLVADRGMSDDEARARMASQYPRATRLDNADYVIDNSGTRADLEAKIDDAWVWLLSLPDPDPAKIKPPF